MEKRTPFVEKRTLNAHTTENRTPSARCFVKHTKLKDLGCLSICVLLNLMNHDILSKSCYRISMISHHCGDVTAKIVAMFNCVLNAFDKRVWLWILQIIILFFAHSALVCASQVMYVLPFRSMER